MQDTARATVEPLRVGRAGVREPELAASVRDADLAAVEMAGEDEVEHAGRHLVDHIREMAEQDAEIGVRVG